MKRSSFSPSSLSLLQEEHVLLEASVARIQPQRAPRGAKKLQSSSYDLLPDCGAAGTADATAELIPDYAEAHMAPAHPPVARRSTQTSEPGENSGASSLLSHNGCDVSPPWPQVVPTQFKTPVWPVDVYVARRQRSFAKTVAGGQRKGSALPAALEAGRSAQCDLGNDRGLRALTCLGC